MIRPLTMREHELILVALFRYADIERSDGNVIVADLLTEIAHDIESKPLRGARGVA